MDFINHSCQRTGAKDDPLTLQEREGPEGILHTNQGRIALRKAAEREINVSAGFFDQEGLFDETLVATST